MIVTLDNGHLAIEGGYWNANGFAVAIVAVVNEGGVDWAAYIGATPDFGPARVEGSVGVFDQESRWGHWSKEDTIRWVARHGCKLPKETALHFFADTRYGAGREVLGSKLEDMEYRP